MKSKNVSIHIGNTILCIISFIACQKDESGEVLKPLPRNSAQVKMEGKSWNQTTSGGIAISTRTDCSSCWAESMDPLYKNFFFLTFYRYYETKQFGRNYFENLSFGAIPLRVGKFELLGKPYGACRPDTIPMAVFFTSEYDAGKDKYEVLKSEKNYIILNKLDKATGLVEGEFAATFIRVHKASDSTYPDTIRFQSSSFTAFVGAKE